MSFFPHPRLPTPLLLLCVALGLGGLPQWSAATAEEPTSELELVSVSAEPGVVGADTLCKLSVELTNRGGRTADAFAFDVLVGGEKLAVYESQLFLDPVPAGATRRIQLFNFWSNEEGRELPAKGPLTVEVRLREALWVQIEKDGDDAAQVWTSVGPVSGLPLSGSVSLDVER